MEKVLRVEDGKYVGVDVIDADKCIMSDGKSVEETVDGISSDLNQKYRVNFFDNIDTTIALGWNNITFNNATVSGYSPIGIVGCVCTNHAAYVNAMNGHLLGGTPTLSVNANASTTADFRIWVLFQKNV